MVEGDRPFAKPWMKPDGGRVISSFRVRAPGNEPILIRGREHQARSFWFGENLYGGPLLLTAIADEGKRLD